MLADHGRPVLRLHLTDHDEGLAQLAAVLRCHDLAIGRRRMSPARVAHGTNPLRDPRDKRLPRIAGPCGLVLFGVTGDLARKKLMPAIYDLANRGLLPPGFSLVGFARRDWADQDFGKVVYDAVKAARPHPVPRGGLAPARRGLPVRARHLRRPDAFDLLAETVRALEAGAGHRRQPRVLPVHPARLLLHRLRAARPQRPGQPAHGAWSRVVIEKPFGHDLKSARELNDIVERVFPPDAVFRIDHYLGKETVQNLLALRFANQMFEPVWNANYVDHVQITMAEDIGIAGRAGYYDGIGAARDVIQNHLLQLLALTAMEEPVSFDAQELRAEKEKVLSAVRLPKDLAKSTARGQYAAGWQGGEKVTGLPPGGGHREVLHHRDLRRDQGRDRHPPLGGGPVLPAHRQAPGQAGHRDRRGVQARPAPALRPTRPPRSSARTPS